MNRRIFIYALMAVVAAAGVVLLALFEFGLTSNSLAGLGPVYEQVALKYLGQSQDQRVLHTRPFCGGAEIDAELKKQPGEIQCLPPPAIKSDWATCAPVASGQRIPMYVSPMSDQLEVVLAVTVDDVKSLAEKIQDIQNLSDQQTQSVLPFGAAEAGPGNVVEHEKTVSSKQCRGYGFVFIAQHYYSR